MPVHVVEQGECIASIARATGVDAAELYAHPDNAALKQKRPNPNILYPGDEVTVPVLPARYVTAPTEMRHRFQTTIPARELRLTLLGGDGKPIAGEIYALEVNGTSSTGKTTGSGGLRERVPGDAKAATLAIRGRRIALQLSCLNPMKETDDGAKSGACARLRNLGYDVPPDADAQGGWDSLTRTALALFQHDAQIEVTGDLDATTLARLEAAHGC